MSPQARLATAIAAGTLVASLAAPAAQADEQGRIKLFGRRYSLIAGISMFVPREAQTRAIYGARAFAPNLTLWKFDSHKGLGISWDLGGERMRDNGRAADFVRGGLGPRLLFADNSSAVAPYLAVRGDAYVARLDHGDWRVKPGANVELGASVLRHVVVSGRYDAVPKLDGIDLSGFTFRVAVKLF